MRLPALPRTMVAPGLDGARRALAWLRPLACLLLVAGTAAHAERNYSAYPHTAPAPKRLEALTAAVPPAPTVQLPALADAAIAAMRDENARPGARAMKLGVVRHLDKDLDASLALRDWSVAPGGHVARVRLAATGARALRIALAVERAPAGTRARFASAHDAALADGIALPSSGTVWSGVIDGDDAVVELFAPDPIAPRDVRVAVSAVGQHFASPLDRASRDLAKSASSTACEVDFACKARDDAALARVGSAVARLSYVNGDYVWVCTGTLLNPADGSFTPYFHTAAHCIHDQATADTVATLWFFEAAACGSSSAAQAVQQSSGATLLFADAALDGTLLRLNEAPPAGAAFAGWDSEPIDAGTAITGIHHPGGDVKKVSEGTATFTGGTFTRVTWNSGVTESGSSGSGLFTATAAPQPDYLLRGGLYGGMSACTGAPPNAYDAYSRLDLLWPKMAPYLGAGARTANFTGPWWDPDEPGWGLALDHQDGVIFATLFTYGADGEPMWLVAPSLVPQPDGSYSGTLHQASGPRFDAAPWSAVSTMMVGTMTLSFEGKAHATLSYTVHGTSITRNIAPMVFGAGAAPVCTLVSGSRAGESNYQDVWWNPDESGWGLGIAHQGNTLFTVLFTYDDAGRPLWLAAPDVRLQPDASYAGTLYRTLGSAADATRGQQPPTSSAVGSVTLRFADGENGTLVYSVNGREVRKPIVRMVFARSAPACR